MQTKKIIKYWEKLVGEKDIDKYKKSFQTIFGKKMEEYAENYDYEQKKYSKDIEKLVMTYENDEDKIDLPFERRWKRIPLLLINKSKEKINEIYNYSDIIENPQNIVDDCIETLCDKIFSILYKIIILEIRYCKNKGLLKGETSESRAKFFDNVILSDDKYMVKFLQGYPEAFRICSLIVENYVKEVLVLLECFKNDKHDIEEKVITSKITKIKKLSFGAGDTHNGGKSVAIVELVDSKKLVYKPRNLDIEENYNNFVNWLNTAMDSKKIRLPRVFYKSGKGWMEFIEYKPCENENEIREYYYNLGKLLCILYTFDGNDMHHENIIAVGNSPVLIDLETFLQPNMLKLEKKDLSDKISEIKRKSIEKSALLPIYMINYRTKEKVDIGGMADTEDLFAPFETDEIDGIDTDEIKLIKKKFKMKNENNNPSIGNKVVNAKDYLDYTEKGFRDTYCWIMNNKDIYMSKARVYFKGIECRVLLRSTQDYCSPLHLSYHPDLLVNKLDREAFCLRSMFDNDYLNDDIIRSEVYQMINADVPYFYTYSDSKDIYHNGEVISKNYCVESIMEVFERKIKNMSIIDMNRQITFMYDSFDVEYNKKGIPTKVCEFDHEDSLINIDSLMDIIKNRAIRDYSDKEFIWFEKKKDELGIVKTDVMGSDLFAGLSGMLLLFNSYSVNTKSNNKDIECLKKMLEKSVDMIIKSYKNTYEKFIEGLGGMTYVVLKSDIKGKITDIAELYIKYCENNFEKIVNDMEELTGNMGVLLTAYEKGVLCERVLNILDKIVDSVLANLLNQKIIQKNMAFNTGYYGIFYQLLRYTKINLSRREEIEKKIYSYIKEEKDIFRKSKEENISFYIEWLFSRIMLQTQGIKNVLLNEDLYNILGKIQNCVVGNDFSLYKGDPKNIVMLYKIYKETNNRDVFKAFINYKNSFYNKVISCEVSEEGYYDVYDDFGLMKGLGGIVYALMMIDERYDTANIVTFE